LPVGPTAPVAPVAPAGPVSPVAPLGPVGPVAPVAPVGPVGPVVPGASLPFKVMSSVGAWLVRRFSLLSKAANSPVLGFATNATPSFGATPSSHSLTSAVTSMATNSLVPGTGTAVATAAPTVGSLLPVTVISLHALVTRSASTAPGTLTWLA